MISKLLSVLLKTNGSDLHLRVGEPASVRVGGELRRVNMAPLTLEHMNAIIDEVTTPEQRREFAKDLDLDLAYQDDQGRYRVNVLQYRNGPGAVFRVISPSIPSPDDLGLPPSVRKLTNEHKGLVLVTGPTGSGKSTTLAALINVINAGQPKHIVTIEDPIEFVHESQRSIVTQREVGRHTTSFARALRAALREDPDVILVGEMRDVETMALAVTAAETGHLVFATLHTMSAAKTVDRVVDAFPGDQQEQIRTQLAGSLKAVIAQQLLPRRGAGGRVAAFEVLLNNPAVANQIREGKTQHLLGTIQTARGEGMITMDDSLLELVKAGSVEPAEAIIRASDQGRFKRALAEHLEATRR
jgi:twitching motility protein PilT